MASRTHIRSPSRPRSGPIAGQHRATEGRYLHVRFPPTCDLTEKIRAIHGPVQDCKRSGSVSHSVVTEGGVIRGGCGSGAGWSRRVHSSGEIRLALVLIPSVGPLPYGRVTAAITASRSCSRPRVKACGCGRSAARAWALQTSRRGRAQWPSSASSGGLNPAQSSGVTRRFRSSTVVPYQTRTKAPPWSSACCSNVPCAMVCPSADSVYWEPCTLIAS